MAIKSAISKHHRASNLSHARHSARVNSPVRDRIMSVVSQDRIASVVELQEVRTPGQQAPDNLAQRLQMLKVVGRDANVINSALSVCRKISVQLGLTLPIVGNDHLVLFSQDLKKQ